ncbi:MAG: hypothetical protein UHP28_01355 [Treponema sp.]|nr:hypothetical protein [Treponema sp.]
MIYTILYYVLFASAVMLYGIGMNRAIVLCDSIHRLLIPVIKTVLSVLLSSIFTWIILKHLLTPLGIIELYPFVAVIIFVVVSVFLELMIRISTKKVSSEFIVSFLIVILTINESLNLFDVIIISLSCIVSFLILIPLLYSIKKRVDLVGNLRVHGNIRSLLLVSLAVLVCALAAGNISWLNPGVIK